MTRLRILHLSDTHILRSGELHLGTTDTRAHLASALAHLQGIGSLDAVVVSGDCSDDGSRDSYEFLSAQVGGFAAAHGATPVYVVGNHDDRAGFTAVLGDGVGGVVQAADAPVDALASITGHTFAVLDTQVPGRDYGQLDEARVRVLAGAVVAAGAPVVLTLHHPPVPSASRITHVLELVNPGALQPLLATGLVRVILAGHYHHQLSSSFGGVPVHVAPGVANVVDPSAGYPAHVTRPIWGAQVVTVRDESVDVMAIQAGSDGPANALSDDLMQRIAAGSGPADWLERWKDPAP
ncbi:metallophosphoesterase [Rudaeicoccus suwonensis]|uniref:Calcineurin-like phosphoesterase family protein n=1 Tax=Rudaeicoccus suwonensis TaxID=657409 RepID=A0A561EA48_9MICO|nr:metallophosphoesterase [Rudaeicoccus suwonensis]TWE12493.1 calcineurin-like phosphoesterase family protein [Rudaeicoccus suwonensis]